MAMIRKVVCPHCGRVAEIEIPDMGEVEDWLPCMEPKGFEWNQCAGFVGPIGGPYTYTDAAGNQLSRAAFIKKHNIDPVVDLKARGRDYPRDDVLKQ